MLIHSRAMIRRGDIYRASLAPARGSEQSGTRPVVVLSGSAMNTHSGLCIVCPLTSKIKGYPGSLKIRALARNGLREDSELMLFQIRTITQKRLSKKLGSISAKELEEAESLLLDVLRN